MKKLTTFLLSTTFCLCAYGQAAPIASYVLPPDLATNPTVDAIASVGDVSQVQYLELMDKTATLQNSLAAQNDLLNNNKTLQQRYISLGLDYQNTAVYTDTQKATALKASYDLAEKNIKLNIATCNKNIDILHSDLNRISRVINNRMESEKAQQDFRKWTSFIFAGLLAIIISGFFFVLFKNMTPNMATILIGESGLQFITLFAIIISVILFGVLNILEGKELAAIISGISGFILGKYNPTGTSQVPPPGPPPAPDPHAPAPPPVG